MSDIIKDGAKQSISRLKSLGIKNTVMLSGYRLEVARYVSSEVGLDKYHAELLPQHKVEHFENISNANKNGKVAFVGDGINDAPVIAISDVGFAMGACWL